MRRVRSVVAIILVLATMMSCVCCSSASEIGTLEDTFFDALKTATGIDKAGSGYKTDCTFDGAQVACMVTVKDGNCVYTLIRYKNPEDAVERFTEFFQSFEAVKDTKNFSGMNSDSIGKTSGTVIFNGMVMNNSYVSFADAGRRNFYSNTDIFGGVVSRNAFYMEAYSINGNASDNLKIKRFLDDVKLKNENKDSILSV